MGGKQICLAIYKCGRRTIEEGFNTLASTQSTEPQTLEHDASLSLFISSLPQNSIKCFTSVPMSGNYEIIKR